MYEDCINLTLLGSNGSGKTLISLIIFKNAYRNRYTFKRISFPEYISIVFSSNKSEEDMREIDKIRSIKFLVIDDLDKEYDAKSEANVILLINLLKYGEDKGLPTIICTNLDLSSIRDRYGETVYSLIENSYSVEMLHEDMRRGSFKPKKRYSF